MKNSTDNPKGQMERSTDENGAEPSLELDEMPHVQDHTGILTKDETNTAYAGLIADAPDSDRMIGFLECLGALSSAPIYSRNSARLLIDGPATYDAMLTAIAAAQHTIHLETYIFADDEVGIRFADALIRKRKEGVVVRVIYDSFGSRESDKAFFARLNRNGVAVLEFNAYDPSIGGDPLDANHRTHRKLLIVDSGIAFTGGINISRLYKIASSEAKESDPTGPGWRDTHVALEGPVVSEFETLFCQNWETGMEPIDYRRSSDQEPAADADHHVTVLAGEGASSGRSAIYQCYVAVVRQAQETVWITQAYFAPGRRLMRAMKQAARKGVDVRLLVPSFSDTNVVVHSSRARYGTLMRSGVKIYEARKTVLHAKTAVIDSMWSTIGSSNLDPRSILHNDEANVVILGDQFGAKMAEQFQLDIQEATEVSYEEWRNRPWTKRLKEFASRLVEYWM